MNCSISVAAIPFRANSSVEGYCFRFFAVGTKVSGVSKTNIGKIVLSVLTVPEQTAIATILTDMDTELETRLIKSCQLKQGMMQALLTGRIRLPLDAAA